MCTETRLRVLAQGLCIGSVAASPILDTIMTSVSFRVPETLLNMKVADFKVSFCLGDERLEEARFKSCVCGECTCKAPVLENVQACACGEFISFLVSR